MPTIITTAKTPEILDEVFKIRYRVFTEEEGKFQRDPGKRIIDRYDAYPTTTNLVVMTDGRVVGSFRLTLDSPVGVPADEYYDFRKLLPEDARIMGAGMLCIAEEYREPRFSSGLIQMTSYFAYSHGVTHTIAPINPDIARMLVRRVGFKIVDEEFTEPHTGLRMIPLVLDVLELKDYFLTFVRQNQLLDFLGDYERWFFKEGESIIRAGEEGKEAFVLIQGDAQIRLPGSEHVFAEIHRGDIFGELALLTDENRSADVVAITDVQVMRLPKEVFMGRFTSNPDQTLNLLKILGQRNLKLIDKLKNQVNVDEAERRLHDYEEFMDDDDIL